MRLFALLALVLLAIGRVEIFAAAAPEVAELSFDARFNKADALASMQTPAWIAKVEQRDGRFVDEPRCWHVLAGMPEGMGRLEITFDRKRIAGSLVATVLFDAGDDADVAVQLFDAQGRAVVVDLYGNLVDVGKDARTDTFVLPLAKYPTAEKMVLRRIRGELKVYGVVMYPVVVEGTPVKEELEKLARVLGDPLSPENPLVKGLKQIARLGNVKIDEVKVTTDANAEPPRGIYPAALPPLPNTKMAAVPKDGLVGHWSFDTGDGKDASGLGHHGKVQAGAKFMNTSRGRVIQLRKNPSDAREDHWDAVVIPSSPKLDLKETMTLSAWVRYSSIAPTWGSQIIWHGDPQFGRDPWELHILTDGTLEFRSDRSVTGRPEFTVFEDEIYLSPHGKPMLNQHVSVWSPDTLAPNRWYYVAATMERTSARIQTMRLYVNGVSVAEVKTPETINYDTAEMWTTIGAVDMGTWQNLDGQIDDVRIYDRALSAAEIAALYGQAWK